jgi:hypothetical protein
MWPQLADAGLRVPVPSIERTRLRYGAANQAYGSRPGLELEGMYIFFCVARQQRHACIKANNMFMTACLGRPA